MTLMANLGDGEEVPVIVKSVTTTEVTLDANHPLAGETLVFEVKLMEIAGGQPKSRIITDF
jgi:peptidylprolyl isomerase